MRRPIRVDKVLVVLVLRVLHNARPVEIERAKVVNSRMRLVISHAHPVSQPRSSRFALARKRRELGPLPGLSATLHYDSAYHLTFLPFSFGRSRYRTAAVDACTSAREGALSPIRA